LCFYSTHLFIKIVSFNSVAALEKAIGLCVDGADVHDICQTIDNYIEEELTKVFSNKKSKKLERGIAFPCCISINEICGHFSPCKEDSVKLKNEDVCKIELGAHIDGYSAGAAHTVVVGGKAKGTAADVVLAAYDAFLAATRSIKIGGLNQDVTAKIQEVCDAYKVEPLQGVLSHRLKKHLIDGNEVIINKETPEQRVDDWEFAPGDVIGLDVYVTSGEGLARDAEARSTVFKREMDMQYNLKSDRARKFFAIVNQKYPTLPFSIRGFEDLTGAKVGVKECVSHDLLMAYPVLTDKPGEIVAHFKATVAVQTKSVVILCGGREFKRDGIESDKKITSEELKGVIAGDLWKKEEKKKEKK
jgi:curved DNA binding protein